MSTAEPVLDTQLVSATRDAPLGHRLTAGGAVSKTLSVWWKHALAFTALSVVVYAPLAVALGLFYGSMVGGSPPGWSGPEGDRIARLGLAVAAVWAGTIVLAVIQAGAVTYGTVRHLSGERVGVGAMLRAGLRRGLPVIGVAFVLWIGVAAGTLLLLVPGVLLFVASCVAVPAAVVERPGVFGAIRRSFALTRGRRGLLFAAGLAVMVIVWVLAAAVQVVVTVVSAALLPPQAAGVGLMMASQAGNVLFSALPLVGMAVAYHELRVEKEGVDTAALARVFE